MIFLLDQLATCIERSIGLVIKQELSAGMEPEEEMTLEAIADIDAIKTM